MKVQMKKQINNKLMSWPYSHSSYRIRISRGNFSKANNSIYNRPLPITLIWCCADQLSSSGYNICKSVLCLKVTFFLPELRVETYFHKYSYFGSSSNIFSDTFHLLLLLQVSIHWNMCGASSSHLSKKLPTPIKNKTVGCNVNYLHLF